MVALAIQPDEAAKRACQQQPHGARIRQGPLLQVAETQRVFRVHHHPRRISSCMSNHSAPPIA